MSDCYRCSSWFYLNEDEEHEGYGLCYNPVSFNFGRETSECDDGCDHPTSGQILGSSGLENAVVSIKTALKILDGCNLSKDTPFLWLKAFGNDDLNKFVLEIRAKCQKNDSVQDIYSFDLFLETDTAIEAWYQRSLEIFHLRGRQRGLQC